jgi:murein DD-endopeptidase MepM/ murein hydrolase activator NlpD
VLKFADLQLRGPVYRYNARTCRYERAGISWPRTLLYVIGLFLCSAALLVGMLSTYDALVESPKERAFQTENAVLVKSTATMKNQLSDLETTLDNISTHDQSLHSKLFATSIPKRSGFAADQPEAVVLGTFEQTMAYIARLEKRSDDLLKNSEGTRISIEAFQPDNKLAITLPVERPFAGMTADDIVSGYGMRVNPFHKATYRHDGIDIMALRGTHVLSTGPGEVISVKYNSVEAGYGNYVEVDHKNGFVTRYAHLQDILVRKGDDVPRGAILGTSGSTGGAVAPHLHYEILLNGKSIDPIRYMVYGLSAMEFEKYCQVASRENQSLD